MMKSLMWLYDGLLADASKQCGTDTSRDYVTMSRRVKHEGMSFLTISLPAFCTDFEKSLDNGQVDSHAFLGFRRTRALPAFLRGLTSQVFDPGSGVLHDVPSEGAISAIRQICLMAKKVLLPCTSKRTKGAYDEYIRVETELVDPCLFSLPQQRTEVGARVPALSRADAKRHENSEGERIRALAAVRFVSGVVWASVAQRNRAYEPGGLEHCKPRHGPGATADLISGNGKYRFSTWHARLESHFPFTAWAIPSLNAVEDGALESIKLLEPEMETPVRVISVPKTLKKPRIIAIEPVCMQYTQQAIAQTLIESIESSPYTSGRVNFRDQSINRVLALESSKSQKYATVDLSDASDRVSAGLVYDMLESVPELRDAVFACRSTRANVPGHGTLCLKKFASMGSALCFPIEAMVFFILCLAGRIRELELPLTSKAVELVAKDVYVYGDDIIVPAHEVPAIARYFTLFGLKINGNKTFGTGRFRESCGMDAYNGVDVTPVYMRCVPPSNRRNVSEIVSFVSFANQLYKRGWWTIARRVRKLVTDIVGDLPHVRDTSPGLGWVSFNGGYSVHRWNVENQSPEVRTLIPRSSLRADPLTGYAALLKCFLINADEAIDEKHLERTVRSGSVTLNRRWAPPY